MKRRTLLLGAIGTAPWTLANEASGYIERFRWLPEDKIDFGLIALSLAKEFEPALDVQAYSKRIDALVEEVRVRTRGATDPEERVYWMNTVLFQEHGFRYDHDPKSKEKQDNILLSGTLRTGMGICTTLPMLYVSVGQRLGYPTAVVLAPNHEFVRYVDAKLLHGNIETTSGGKRFTDAEYVQSYGIKEVALRNGTYMRALSRREYLGELLFASGYCHALRKEHASYVAYLKAASLLAPRRAEIIEQIGAYHEYLSKLTTGDESTQHWAKFQSLKKKALDMGYVEFNDLKPLRSAEGWVQGVRLSADSTGQAQ